MNTIHQFHIPVMGVGFTLDSPIKVAKYGINSCISLVQDHVVEKARKLYASMYNLPYHQIPLKETGHRYKRITAYLNMVQEIVSIEFDKLMSSEDGRKTYIDLLPSNHTYKKEYEKLHHEETTDLQWAKFWRKLHPGEIEVNIMSKLDAPDEESGVSDALAALKGFAESEIHGNIVFSAGINPRLITYLEQFEDFFPTETKKAKKGVILKVSDFRSAMIQAKMLVKKGVWITEFRIESGLNCGGHTFATQGHLLGPVLEEFKEKREDLFHELNTMYEQAVKSKDLIYKTPDDFIITVQGGVGTHEEHEFLMKEYGVQRTGWGSPFLLVPEATSVDEETLTRLAQADVNDIKNSHASPLGITYSNLKTSNGQELLNQKAEDNKPGSPCFRKHVLFNEEFGKPLCIASREYQKRKIASLKTEDLSQEAYEKAYEEVVEKECICDGLAVPFLKLHGLLGKDNVQGSSVCPGPNTAYFDRIYSLKEMADHIYGKIDVIKKLRPHMFLKELDLYMTYFTEELKKLNLEDKKQTNYLRKFKANLLTGIAYYETLFKQNKDWDKLVSSLNVYKTNTVLNTQF